MPTCLLGLGSNEGDRAATLRAALAEIEALPDTWLLRQSSLFECRPVGGPPGQGPFLNAAAVVETTIAPLSFLQHLQRIETRHGRVRGAPWSARPLDVDLLLYGNEVAETEMLTLPHPRMSFRRFVLEPAAEVAPKLLHPVIGWPVERLLLHLNEARDEVALLSPSDALRQQVAELIVRTFGAAEVSRPTFDTAEALWPAEVTAWIALPPSSEAAPPSRKRRTLPYAAAAFPKLTVLLDATEPLPGSAKAQWSAIVRQPGRGPTLRLQASQQPAVEAEVVAAIESVRSDLGRAGGSRLE